MVCDDINGKYYIAEENIGVYQYGAEPTDGTAVADRVTVDKNLKLGGHITPQVEGLTIFHKRDGGGYLLASNQGSAEVTVYDRKTLKYLAKFKLVDGPVTDGVRGTDGIDCISTALGKAYPNGLFISHDGFNRDGDVRKNQNYKYVDWSVIVAAAAKKGIKLTSDPLYDPRADLKKAVRWTCSMHPSVNLLAPGKCPICRMDLIQGRGATPGGVRYNGVK